jgi:S-DNA-T family DNA segregation ATPase FtsK/SpoIIIE
VRVRIIISLASFWALSRWYSKKSRRRREPEIMPPRPVEITVSQVRDALWKAEAAAGGLGPTALAGRLFHETAAGLLCGPAGWDTVLGEENLEDWRALSRHAYERLLGPRLASHEAALKASGPEALWLWRAVNEFCQWLCGVLTAAREKGWLATEGWLGSEKPLARKFHRPSWRAPVRVSGVADALLRDPRSGRWCLVEFKLGDATAALDLGQAALYHALLGGSGAALAVIRFVPQRREILLSAADVAPAQERLLDLIGRLAAVVDTVPQPPAPEYDELGKKLIRVLESLGLKASLAAAPLVGPAFVRFTLAPGRSAPVRRIMARAEDLGVHLGLPTPMIHIEERRLVVDVARERREVVPFSRVLDVLRAPDPLQGSAVVPLGVDLNNAVRAVALSDSDSPHVLVAGTAGSGKSEWLRCALAALILSNTPETLRLVLMDPKRTSFNELAGSPFLWHPQALLYPPEGSPVEQLDTLIDEMESRYKTFQQAGAGDLAAWRERTGEPMPRIVCAIDEFADLMADPQERKQFEQRVVRLGAKARAAGIHLILATQHPDAKTVTGRLQANLSVRICLKTATWQQSMVALKARGAERLLGKGDLLFSRGDRAWRYQAPFLSEAERRQIFAQHRIG